MAHLGKTTVKIVPQPDRLSVPLFPHQKANIYNMELLEKNKYGTLPSGEQLEGSIGILGDPPGTGKTLTIIGLICRNKMKWDSPTVELTSQTCSNVDGSIRITRKETFTALQTNLILTPPSIFHQWESEIRKTDLTYKLVRQRTDMNELDRFEIVVCTLNMYNDLAERYKDCVFKRFIYDEMDSAYIPNMAQVHAGHTWFVSATFESLLAEINRSRKVHYMKRLFMNIISDKYTRQDLLDCVTVRSSDGLRALRPIPTEYKTVYYNVRRAPVVEALHQYMDVDLIQMIDSGNIQDAIRHLGGTEEESNIADLLRHRAQKKVREAEMKVAEYSGRQKADWEARLAVDRSALREIESRIEKIETDDCCLCSLPMQYPTLMDCCQQICCARCVVKWLKDKKNCPFCRKADPSFTHIKGYSVESDAQEDEKSIQSPVMSGDKYANLIRIAKNGKKVLVFSSHSTQFAAIAEALRSNNISCSLLSGAAVSRQNTLESYKNGDTRVLILNSRTNGTGLNLQCTTDIILWHSMPRELMSQLIGRAVRYGLDHPVTVHKFYAESEDGNASE